MTESVVYSIFAAFINALIQRITPDRKQLAFLSLINECAYLNYFIAGTEALVRKPYEVLRLDYVPGVPFIETPLVNPLPLPPILTTLPASPDIDQRSVDATITMRLLRSN